MEAFEYAIKKDIRNNPIVREVDEARHRELWRWTAIGASSSALLLFSAWQHFELLRHGYRIEQMQRERARKPRVNRHLRLEIETLRSPTADRAARDRDQLRNGPRRSRAMSIVIERVEAAEPPARIHRRQPVDTKETADVRPDL